jgi:hypothetical protein
MTTPKELNPKPAKEEIIHRDMLGRKLNVGDFVAYPRRNSQRIGQIIKMNPKMPRVQEITNRKYGNEANIYTTDMVLLDGPDVTFYILKNSA